MTLEVLESPFITLQEFIVNNPEAKLEEKDNFFVIENPWGDDTLELIIQKSNIDAINSLNFLRLPPRFTGIWHRDTRDLEFIFTYIRKDDPLYANNFVFNFKGKSFKCEYGIGTKRLQKIIEVANIIARASESNFRNIGTLQVSKTIQERDHSEGSDIYQLTSFFIRNADISEDDLPELALHINFYMRYFDVESPRIIIHPEPIPDENTEIPCRFPFGSFPNEISGQVLDPFLLTLWDSAVTATDPIRIIISSFQILEYGAFYFLKDNILRDIRRALSMPEAILRQEEISKEILDTITIDRSTDEDKIKNLIHQVVDPKVIWKEIEQKKQFFSEPTNFDGGFLIDPLIKNDSSEDNFIVDWFPKFPATLIDLRNALVHSRERRQSSCISPTKRNLCLLKPWANIALTTSVQIILYRDI